MSGDWLGVLLGGLAGLYLAQFAHGGPVAQLGFGSLAVCWLFTGLQAYRAIRRRDLRANRCRALLDGVFLLLSGAAGEREHHQLGVESAEPHQVFVGLHFSDGRETRRQPSQVDVCIGSCSNLHGIPAAQRRGGRRGLDARPDLHGHGRERPRQSGRAAAPVASPSRG